MNLAGSGSAQTSVDRLVCLEDDACVEARLERISSEESVLRDGRTYPSVEARGRARFSDHESLAGEARLDCVIAPTRRAHGALSGHAIR